MRRASADIALNARIVKAGKREWVNLVVVQERREYLPAVLMYDVQPFEFGGMTSAVQWHPTITLRIQVLRRQR